MAPICVHFNPGFLSGAGFHVEEFPPVHGSSPPEKLLIRVSTEYANFFFTKYLKILLKF
jgi:hypothetical protein